MKCNSISGMFEVTEVCDTTRGKSCNGVYDVIATMCGMACDLCCNTISGMCDVTEVCDTIRGKTDYTGLLLKSSVVEYEHKHYPKGMSNLLMFVKVIYLYENLSQCQSEVVKFSFPHFCFVPHFLFPSSFGS